MALRSKTFVLRKGESLDQISDFLLSEIGLDGHLIQGVESSVLTDDLTSYTVLYNQYPKQILDHVSPRLGGIFATGIQMTHAEFLFSSPIDFSSVQSGAFLINNTGISLSGIHLDRNSNNYLVRLDLTGHTSATGFHEIRIDSSKIKKADGTPLEYSPVAGYVIHNQSSAHLGDQFPNWYDRRRGRVRASVVPLSKGIIPQVGISEFLLSRGISDDRLISFTVSTRAESTIDVFFLYFSSLEPQIVAGFPLQNTLFPDVSAPPQLTLVFKDRIDKSQLTNDSGRITLSNSYTGNINIDPAHIAVLNDLRTVRISTAPYLTGRSLYNLTVRPGLRTYLGDQALEKPIMFSVVLDTYEGAGSLFSGVISGAPTGASYITFAPELDNLPNSLMLTVSSPLSVIAGGSLVTLDYGGGIADQSDVSLSNTIKLGQALVYSGGSWRNTGVVQAFNNRTGFITGFYGDYTWGDINKTISNIADITTRDHTSLTSIGTKSHAQLDADIVTLTNDIDFVSGIARYASGKAVFVSGVAYFASGLAAYASGVADYASGKAIFASGVAFYASGLADTALTIANYASGVAEYASGKSIFVSGVAYFASGLGSYASGLSHFVSGFSNYVSGQFTSHAASSIAHNTTSTIVGIDDVQTLTNKTMIGLTNLIAATHIQTSTVTVVLSGATRPESGQFIKATGPNIGEWSSGELSNLADVTIPAPHHNDILSYNSALGKWVSFSPSSLVSITDLDNLANVQVGNTIHGEILVYNTGAVSGTNTGQWMNTQFIPVSGLSKNYVTGEGLYLSAGVSGAVVGTIDTQTLTSKTLVDFSNNISANRLRSPDGGHIVVDQMGSNTSGKILKLMSTSDAGWYSPVETILGLKDTNVNNSSALYNGQMLVYNSASVSGFYTGQWVNTSVTGISGASVAYNAGSNTLYINTRAAILDSKRYTYLMSW